MFFDVNIFLICFVANHMVRNPNLNFIYYTFQDRIDGLVALNFDSIAYLILKTCKLNYTAHKYYQNGTH